jgi:tungstate transport system ATP-binding protein
MNENIALSLKNVSYSHNEGKALHDVTLDIHKAKTTVILGPNGAGKSILLKLCHGLLTPTSGKVIRNTDYNNSAMVFPKPVLLRRTALKNITYILDKMGVRSQDQDSIALKALEEFEMVRFANTPARQLSSGEKQRLSLIRALLQKPDILYLDEPTSNLDPRATAFLENMINKSHMQQTTIVMATHDLMQTKRIGQYIIFIDNGSVIETSIATDFFKNPTSQEARNFIEGKI